MPLNHLLLILLLSSPILLTAACGPDRETSKEIFYVGTFADEGLFILEFDRSAGQFTEIGRLSDPPGPNFQALHPDGTKLYSVSRAGETGRISAYRIDPQTGLLELINEIHEESRGQNHISIDPLGEFAYVSNGGEETLSVYRIREDGGVTEAIDLQRHSGSSVHPRQGSAYMHSNIPSPDGRFVYASDLGIDRIMIYETDRENGRLRPAATPYAELDPGSGPRHFTLHPTEEYAYSVNELANTITAFRRNRESGALDRIQQVGMLPEGYDEESYSADIHISPDGRFLYATNRGHDSVVIYAIDPASGELETVGHEPTRGGHPRNFAIDSRGEFLFMTNRDGDNLVLFEIDRESGLLRYTGVEASIPLPVCVTQIVLEP